MAVDDRIEIILSELKRGALKNCGPDARIDHVVYSMAAQVLGLTLGKEWVHANVFQMGKGDPFLRLSAEGSSQRTRFVKRVIHLGELVFNLRFVRFIPGTPNRLLKLKSVDLESAIVELEGADVLNRAGVPFEFVAEQGERGLDYDVVAIPNGGPRVACEMKCKKFESDYSQVSLVRTIRKARSQLPRDQPGIVFVRIPDSWGFAPGVDEVRKAIELVFRTTQRLAAVILLCDHWHTLPGGSSFVNTSITVIRNWTSPHIWTVGTHILDRIEHPEMMNSGFNFYDAADIAE